MEKAWLGRQKDSYSESQGASCLSFYPSGGPAQRAPVPDQVAPRTKTSGSHESPYPCWDAGALGVRYHEASAGSGWLQNEAALEEGICTSSPHTILPICLP